MCKFTLHRDRAKFIGIFSIWFHRREKWNGKKSATRISFIRFCTQKRRLTALFRCFFYLFASIAYLLLLMWTPSAWKHWLKRILVHVLFAYHSIESLRRMCKYWCSFLAPLHFLLSIQLEWCSTRSNEKKEFVQVTIEARLSQIPSENVWKDSNSFVVIPK